MKNKLTLVFLALVLFGCRSTNIMTISVVMPAPIDLPPYLKTVGTLNRSLPSEANKKFDKVDQILSLEGFTLDKEGGQKAVIGLTEELKKNDRFAEVKLIDNGTIKSPDLGMFPSTLSWDMVEKLCAENKVDGIFVLEFFDTDTKVNYTAIPVTIKNPLGINIPGIEHNASILTMIKTGWRIYDPINKRIVDEFAATQDVATAGRGINPVAAVMAVVGRKNAVLERSYGMGKTYALGILPYKTRVTRDYYVRGSANFKIAKRKAQTGNWEGAAELWKKELSNKSNKVAGRACYNMAISNEINGNLDSAIYWSQKSYENYNNRLALKYVNILRFRKEQNAQLNRQEAKKD